jgi:hypothetical protein
VAESESALSALASSPILPKGSPIGFADCLCGNYVLTRILLDFVLAYNGQVQGDESDLPGRQFQKRGLNMSRLILSGLMVVVNLAIAGQALATAPVCEDGRSPDANGGCRVGDGVFRLPNVLDDRGSGRKRNCQMPGTTPEEGLKRRILGAGSGNASESEVEYWENINGGKAQSEGQDPDMGDREGVPPSAGTGTR